jgi:aspartate-semialdehyde dehydrogenase
MQIFPFTMNKNSADTTRRQPERKPKHLAIVGATGAVGVEMLRVLERREIPVASLRLLASPRSAGKKLAFRGEEMPVEPLGAESFAGTDIALFSAGGGISREYAPQAVSAGAVVVDNSSAFRMDPKVPLVVPEINAADAAGHSGIVANPNCTTAITLMALHPLHQAFGLQSIIASSYQAVSGTGATAIEELRRQVAQIASGQPVTREVYPHQIAFNVLPHVDSFLEDGYTREEMKMQNEGRRILNLPSLLASVTCVRVPVYRAHSVSVTAVFERPVSLEKAREALAAAPGIRIQDDPSRSVYPMPIECSGEDDCRIGRLRLDCALPNALSFWVCGDQLLKGAALNAVQIAELL